MFEIGIAITAKIKFPVPRGTRGLGISHTLTNLVIRVNKFNIAEVKLLISGNKSNVCKFGEIFNRNRPRIRQFQRQGLRPEFKAVLVLFYEGGVGII